MIDRKSIVSAYSQLRELDSSVPEHVLDFMFHAALNALQEAPQCEPQSIESANDGFEQLKSLFIGSTQPQSDNVAALLEQAQAYHNTCRTILDKRG